jgi:alkylhydroperoxidase/carboxymuconolactone decarboxylase family protein YurZ
MSGDLVPTKGTVRDLAREAPKYFTRGEVREIISPDLKARTTRLGSFASASASGAREPGSARP